MWGGSTAMVALTASQRQALVSVMAGATAAAAWYKSTKLEAADDDTSTAANENTNPIEINLMDKIASKIYLNPSCARSNSNTSLQKRLSDIPPSSVTNAVVERPRGVPSRLRILAIDLPEMRHQAFSHGECRVALDRVYPDGIAPPQKVHLQHNNNNANNNNNSNANNNLGSGDSKAQAEVEQKAWVKSMVKCLQHDQPNKIGVELLEASFADLNPKNLRKTRQVGGYHYDPGKYTHASKGVEEKAAVEEVQEEDELEAPWNQYAWIEELKLRVHGLVPFGASLEPSSRWERYFTGNHYKTTISSQQRWYLPSFLQSTPEGIDGHHNHNWASHKPHAVIANGAAVQRMPSGLRLLQKTCRDANVPLFVLYDPRVWGGNTHANLHSALRDVRFTVKQNIILSAMEHQSGYSRGRRVGRMERTVEQWAQAAKQDRQRRQDALRKRQWQSLDAVALEKRLMEHGVVRKEDQDGTIHRQYTPGMIEVARQCVADVEEEQQQQTLEEQDTEPAEVDDGGKISS